MLFAAAGTFFCVNTDLAQTKIKGLKIIVNCSFICIEITHHKQLYNLVRFAVRFIGAEILQCNLLLRVLFLCFYYKSFTLLFLAGKYVVI